MAINFPSSPTNGQQHTVGQATWTYDSTQTKWKITRTAASVASDTAPTNPQVGQLWFDTDTGELYVYYNDGSSSQWVEVGSFADFAVLDEDDMASNSATSVPTQQSTKAYVDGRFVISASQSLSTGTSKDFSIPSWAKRITVAVAGISTNGSSPPIVQIGTGGVPTTSGYVGIGCNVSGTPTFASITAGLALTGSWAGADVGTLTMTIYKVTGNQWASSSQGQVNTTSMKLGTSLITLAGTLDFLRLTMTNGTDAFDAGTVSIMYE
jgi:hypothetical protein